ncbi:hypothetical protein [Planococcus sp. ISL-109]|uniref:hypothetical protein n=1 Tax=Planococcus sp. ISL-109 TaxID=2819166 RepID=UPI001BE94905|nr:hypothetical protein [Planococcus sp. ISL-109]MBT2581369.1 hypothetical protein [Planococcus sp. ISL-109]
MKGFLSLVTITLIAVFCGLIILAFYSEPFENWQNQERLQAYTETRENTVPQRHGKVRQAGATEASQPITAYTASVRSCPAP